MRALIVIATAYVLSVAVIFAGMILTPTESSREADRRSRERFEGFEFYYLLAKIQVACLWPLFLLKTRDKS